MGEYPDTTRNSTAGGHSPDLDARFMRLALDQAQWALDEGEVPIGAVVVCEGLILGRGRNMTERLHDPSAHAEMLALSAALESQDGKFLPRSTMYVTVEPCPMCASALYWARIGRLVYGTPDPKRGYTLFTPPLLHPKTVARHGVLEQECRELIQSFFASRRLQAKV